MPATMRTYLLLDVGNSTTVIARYEQKKISEKHQIKTCDLIHCTILKENNLPLIVSSVVPEIDRYLQTLPNVQFVRHDNISGITLNSPTPEQFGADRLVNAMAAYSLVKSSCLIIDSGTAITFCYVDQSGIYQGGSIFPGMHIASQSLNDYTAKIPLIHVSPRESFMGKTTQDAVQAGLYYGYIDLINGAIDRYKKYDPGVTVIGTGNGLDVLKNAINIDRHEPDLILKGLAIWVDATQSM